MKNPITNFRNHLNKKSRKKELQKRVNIYDSVSDKLEGVVKEKRKLQKLLVKEIKDYMFNVLGYDSKSKFIPKKFKNSQEIKIIVRTEFGVKMDLLNITINDNLKLEWI